MKKIRHVTVLLLLMGCAAQKQPKAPLAVVQVDNGARILGVDIENICPGSLGMIAKDAHYDEMILTWDKSGKCWDVKAKKF